MKNLIITITAILALLTLASCSSGDSKRASLLFKKPMPPFKTPIVVLYDISTSNDEFALLNGNHLTSIYYAIANNGGGKFYAYLIKTDSRKQEVFEFEIPAIDTLELKGNMYQIKKRKDKNLVKRKQLESHLAEFTAQAKQKLLLPKTAPFTDLENALALAKITLEQPNIASTNVNLVIISDGINDLPPIDGPDKMKPVDFGTANVILVRPINKEYVIGKSTVTNSINDCIENLKF